MIDWRSNGGTTQKRRSPMRTGRTGLRGTRRRWPGGHLNKFVPSAETFFRMRRWEDDPATWLRGAATNGTGEPREPYKPGGRKGTTITLSAKPQTKPNDDNDEHDP
jgi:hypothetical protein